MFTDLSMRFTCLLFDSYTYFVFPILFSLIFEYYMCFSVLYNFNTWVIHIYIYMVLGSFGGTAFCVIIIIRFSLFVLPRSLLVVRCSLFVVVRRSVFIVRCS